MAPGILLASLLSVTAVAALVRLAPLHPVQLWTLPWAISTDLYVLRLLPYRDLSWATMSLVLCATAAFIAAALLGEHWMSARPRAATPSTAAYDHVQRAAAACVILMLVLLAAFLAQAISRYGLHGAVLSPAPLRKAIAQAEFTVTIKYIYFDIAACGLAAVAAARSSGRRRLAWLAVAVACVACTYFATGRATIVAAAIVVGVAFALASSGSIRRSRFLIGITSTIALALVVFLAGGALIGKTYANNSDFKEIPNFFRDHPALSDFALPYEYASGSIAALDVQVKVASTWGDAHGCALLHPICTGLRKLGLDVPSVAPLRPFTRAPFAWNTYTALDVPLIDAGTALAAPALALLGLLLGGLWGLARWAPGWTVAYAVEAVALVESAGSFNFTATYLVGGILLAVLAILSCKYLSFVSLSLRPLRAGFNKEPAGG